MKNLSSITLKIILLVSLISLLGCTAQPTAVPTVDPQIFASTVSAAKTEAVQTVYARLTQDVTATTRPTETATLTAVPPTLTPTRVIVVTQAPTYTQTQGAIQCSITKQSPKYGTYLAGESDFDLAVTFKNIGTDKWSKDNIDFQYVSGAKFQKSRDVVDLPNDVAAGDSVDVVVDMSAKTDKGTQNATWALMLSSTPICTVYVHLIVN